MCVTFLPALVLGLYDEAPADPAGMMIAGVFLGWYGNALRSTWSTVWRALGMPEWFANTDITSYILFSLGWGVTTLPTKARNSAQGERASLARAGQRRPGLGRPSLGATRPSGMFSPCAAPSPFS